MPFTYSFSRPELVVDCLALSWDQKELRVLLVRNPGSDRYHWRFPRTHVRSEENLDHAVERMLHETTGQSRVYFEQAQSYVCGQSTSESEPTVVVSYYALMYREEVRHRSHLLPHNQEWISLDDLPVLSPEQRQVLTNTHRQLQDGIRYQPLAFHLLPPKFSLSQIQAVYEAVLGYPLDKRNFRKKLQAQDLLQELDEFEKNVPYRAAKLFRLSPHTHRRSNPGGFHLKV